MPNDFPQSSPPGRGTPFFVARQPIFDAGEQVWGYELLFRASAQASTAEVREADRATASVIADGFALAFSGVDKTKKAFINFPQRLLLDGSVDALPKEICVVEILETIVPDAAMLAALRAIKARGYTLALDDYVGQPGFEAVLPLADIVKVDLLEVERRNLPKLAFGLLGHGCRLLAEKVEDRATYDLTRTLGFTLFQGYYFSRPETMAGSKASSSTLARVRIMHVISGPDFNVRELTSIISTDPGISYRLLKFINSAAFSLRGRIKSIQQALTLLGKEQIRQWALAVIVSDFDGTDKIQEAAYASLLRARYLESTARQYGRRGVRAETLFLLGLFSKLDVLLGQPMEELLKNIPLDRDVADALLSRPSSLSGWLALVQALEIGDWTGSTRLLDELGLDWRGAAANYAEAISWTQTLLRLKKDGG